ncbi:hypothetical protein C0991_004702 [Blastosporella zonata]|nr:hypothetical protein C0991_004702 [Blastosporella zonata]
MDHHTLTKQEAEDKVLEYMQREQMNRPYGAVDVSANLKGAIPKAATQKILIALTEKGQLVQKIYGKLQSYSMRLLTYSVAGKTTFFVINQSNIDVVPSEELAALEATQKVIDEENKILLADLRTAQSGIFRIYAS